MVDIVDKVSDWFEDQAKTLQGRLLIVFGFLVYLVGGALILVYAGEDASSSLWLMIPLGMVCWAGLTAMLLIALAGLYTFVCWIINGSDYY